MSAWYIIEKFALTYVSIFDLQTARIFQIETSGKIV